MNPPMQLLTAITGFEDQRAHQHPSAPKCLSSIAQKNLGCCRNLVPRGRRLCSVRNRYADWVQAQPARKTSHREVFLDCANRKLAWGLFSYKSPLFCNPNFGLQNSPAKAPDDKELRPLRRATSRRCPLDTRHLLKKVDENFYFANSVPRVQTRCREVKTQVTYSTDTRFGRGIMPLEKGGRKLYFFFI